MFVCLPEVEDNWDENEYNSKMVQQIGGSLKAKSNSGKKKRSRKLKTGKLILTLLTFCEWCNFCHALMCRDDKEQTNQKENIPENEKQ